MNGEVSMVTDELEWCSVLSLTSVLVVAMQPEITATKLLPSDSSERCNDSYLTLRSNCSIRFM